MGVAGTSNPAPPRHQIRASLDRHGAAAGAVAGLELDGAGGAGGGDAYVQADHAGERRSRHEGFRGAGDGEGGLHLALCCRRTARSRAGDGDHNGRGARSRDAEFQPLSGRAADGVQHDLRLPALPRCHGEGQAWHIAEGGHAAGPIRRCAAEEQARALRIDQRLERVELVAHFCGAEGRVGRGFRRVEGHGSR